VVIVVENLPVPFDRRVWQEARSLVKWGAKVSIISPIAPGAEAPEEAREGIAIHRHPLPVEASGALGYAAEYSCALWHQTRLAWRIWRRGGFDAIHGCNPPDLVFLIALQFRLLGVRFLYDHHDITPELYEAKFARRGLFWGLMRLLERVSFACADVSIATNGSYRAIALDRGGMRRGDVFTVRSGPDLARLRPVAPSRHWHRGRRYLLAYVGVMGAQEGIDLLLRSMVELTRIRGRRDLQLVLMGGGPALAEMRALSEELGLSDCVTFTGRAPDADLASLLSSADICVNPDRVTPMNDKSTMNKILEYMAFSRPIVQFDVTEGRVSAQGASLYARPNDPGDFAECIERLLADPEARERMGRFGRARIEAALSWPHQEPALLAGYQRLFGKRDRGRAGRGG
jgi:glycosyltransferase involved in cell wall biosynthesis